MENEEVQPDTTTEPEVETVETPEVAEPIEEAQAPEVDVEQLQATNKKLYERAKTAEAALKALKPQPAPAKVSSQPNVEETVLLANGMPEDLLSELKAVAQVRRTSLLKAQTDPIFVAVKEKYEREKKQSDASLPASRGAGSVKAQKSLATPNLSREEHKRLVQEALGR